MPKMKTHSGAKKRFKPTSGGTQIKRACQNKNHILNKKSRERKRRLRQGDYVGDSSEKAIRTLLQTGGKPKRPSKKLPSKIEGWPPQADGVSDNKRGGAK